MTTELTATDLIRRATADAPKRPIPDALRAARRDVLAAADTLATIDDATLTRPWTWKGDSEEELRYGFYRISEAFERAAIDADAAIRASGSERERSVELIRPATVARWDLQGLLHGLDAGDWDADPGNDEWTIRQTLGHLIASQRGYTFGTSWWLERRLPVGDPELTRVPDDLGDDLPSEEEEAAGTPDEVRARLDEALDEATERFAVLTSDQLAYAGRWSGFAVDLGFRQSRWASHIREHTIQVEKTLVMLRRDPSEVDRLIRLILGTWGSAESAVFGAAPSEAALGILRQAASEATATAGEIAALASG